MIRPKSGGAIALAALVALAMGTAACGGGGGSKRNQIVVTVTTTSMPNGIATVAYSLQFQATGGMAPYTWTLVSAAPPGMSLSSTGDFNGTPTTPNTYSVQVRAVESSTQAVAGEATLTWTVLPANLTITTAAMPDGVEGASYTLDFQAAAGTLPYTWQLTSAAPPGMTLSATGTFSGSPLAASTYTVDVQVTDSATPAPGTDTASFQWVVSPPPVTIDTASMTDGDQGQPYSLTFTASDGVPPYTWSLLSPPVVGMSLSGGGVWSGTPAAAGTYPVEVRVTDSTAPTPGTDTRLYSWIVAPPSVFVSSTFVPDGTAGTAYSFDFQAMAGTQPYTWALLSAPVGGMNLSATGTWSGTPAAPGLYPVEVEVTDSTSPTPDTDTALFDWLVFSSGGTPPGVLLTPIPDPQRGMIDVGFNLSDADGDPVYIEVEYSTDSGVTWQQTTSGPTGIGAMAILQASPTPTRWTFVWDSKVDLGNNLFNARVRVTPTDTLTGLGAESPDFVIDNSPAGEIFIPAPPMALERMNHAMVLLADGNVLVCGGEGLSAVIHQNAELFDVTTMSWRTLANAMTTPRAGHTATLMADGRVLITGGNGGLISPELDSSEVYDPVAQTFTASGIMDKQRIDHSAVRVPTGVVVTGGFRSSPATEWIDTAEEWETATSMFSAPATFFRARYRHTSTVLPNGNVLLYGGSDAGGDATSEEYDPVARMSVTTSDLPGQGDLDHARATLLQGGQVLLTGGSTGRGWSSIWTTYDSAFIYTTAGGLVPATNNLGTNRARHTSTLLEDGRVMVCGGEENMSPNSLQSAELFEPASQTWTNTDGLDLGRLSHRAVRLADGRVLITGGKPTGAAATAEVERYHP